MDLQAQAVGISEESRQKKLAIRWLSSTQTGETGEENSHYRFRRDHAIRQGSERHRESLFRVNPGQDQPATT